jgi:hypothetical protein
MIAHRGHLILTISLTVPLVLAGCAGGKGKVRLSSAQMCQAHGGTYNSSAQTCATPAASTATAQQACQRMGGYYDSFAQHCEVGRD